LKDGYEEDEEDDSDSDIARFRKKRRRGTTTDDVERNDQEGGEANEGEEGNGGKQNGKGKRGGLTTDKALAKFLDSHSKTDADRAHARNLELIQQKNAHELAMANAAAQARQMAFFERMMERG
jgi:hypothetical protein